MDIISDKTVIIRKVHRCFACLRLFSVGSPMRRQVNNYDGIASVYSCKTCDALMDEFHDWFYDDGENIFPEGCVKEHYRDMGVENCNTPEEILEALRKLGGTKEETL